MLKKEFKIIYDLATSDDTLCALEGDSPEAVQDIRSSAAVYYSRLGHELALARNKMGQDYLQQVAAGNTIKTAEHLAEELYNSVPGNEVTRREIEYLREGLDKLMNSCSSKLREKAV